MLKKSNWTFGLSYTIINSGDFMNTIENNITNEIIINKSRFITKLFIVNNENEIKIFLDNLKKEYKGANHYCYAYIIDNIQRFNDDNEPSGTAGIPILNILKANNLNHVLCIVIRYFGGIKLGTGGLIRAYGNSTKKALNKTNIVEYINYIDIEITFAYENQKTIDKLLVDLIIFDKKFNNDIIYKIRIPDHLYENIIKQLSTIIKNPV